MRPRKWSYVEGLAAALFWGASFVAGKVALSEISPVTMTTLRFGIGVVVLAFAVWRLHVFEMVGKRDLLLLVVLGAIGIPIHQGLQANGLVVTAATSVGWLVALTPVFMAILARIFLSESFGTAKVIGLIVAFLGAFLVVTKGTLTTDVLRLPSTMGDSLALASSLNWAIFSVISKPVLRRWHPTLVIAFIMAIGWILLLPFFVSAQGWNEISRLSMSGWIAVGFLGVFCSGLAYIFWYDALARLDASQAAAFIYIEPLVTVVVASIVLSEVVTLVTFVGGLTILLGVYLVNRSNGLRVKEPVDAEVSVAGD